MSAVLSTRPLRLGVVAVLSTLTIYYIFFRGTGLGSLPYASFGNGNASITISPEAHKFNYADDFLPHFENLTQMPTISMSEAKASCQFENISAVNFAFGTESGWGMDLSWTTSDRSEKELRTRREQWHDFILNKNDTLLPYDAYADRFEGRGIIIIGGQGRSFKRIRVLLKQLTRLGCKLPVEIHYWGIEMGWQDRQELAGLYHTVYYQNIASPDVIMTSYYNKDVGVHYSLKTVALINARFEHILMLDSDNIPVIDPDLLFESKTYQEFGTVFWPDIARTRINNPMWPITNTGCRSVLEWELESGQFLVNKKKFWYHLQLAAYWITDTEHGGYYRQVMLGDKDTFRWAWHALKTKFGVPSRWVTTIGTYNDGYYCGHTFGQHHPDKDGPLAFLHGGTMKTMAKEVIQWQKDVNGGIFQYYKRDPRDQDKTSNPNMGIKWDGQDYLPAERKPKTGEVGWCTDFFDLDPRPLQEILPLNVWNSDIFDAIDGYWMLKDNTVVSIADGNL